MQSSTCRLHWVLLFACLSAALPLARADDLTIMLNKMAEYAQRLAQQVEELYVHRCSSALDDCAYQSYHVCSSRLPNSTCLARGVYNNITQCNGCGASFDDTTSSVSFWKEDVDDSNNPITNNKLIETICFTRYLDAWFLKIVQEDKAYWDGLKLSPPPMFFGSADGMMRIFPGRPRRQCSFDPRTRPWYVAASSGPKNIILVLDTSTSMQGNKLEKLKDAVVQVITALTASDNVAIVYFDSTIYNITDDRNLMFAGNEVNKKKIISQINNFTTGQGSDFYAAFDVAFDILDDFAKEGTSACNSAILFFTDGKMNDLTDNPKSDTDVIELVTRRVMENENKTGRDLFLFTYGLETDSTETPGTFLSELACSTTHGVYTKIVDPNHILESLSSYYKLFSLGLGSNRTSWVELYAYATGDVRGTTVSVPVYDTLHEPPIFVGVVGVDRTEAELKQVLGDYGDSGQELEIFISGSTHTCYDGLDLSSCRMESFRLLGGNESLCSNNCTSQYETVEPQQCSGIASYPKVFNNSDDKGRNYTERVCCPDRSTAWQQCFPNSMLNFSWIDEMGQVPSDSPATMSSYSPTTIPTTGLIPSPAAAGTTISPGGISAIVMGALVVVGFILWWIGMWNWIRQRCGTSGTVQVVVPSLVHVDESLVRSSLMSGTESLVGPSVVNGAEALPEARAEPIPLEGADHLPWAQLVPH